MIEFKKVTKVYPPETVALRDVSFHIDRGEMTVVAGRSGAGKTTLLKLMLAEERPTRGEVVIDGSEVQDLSSRALPSFRRAMGAVFQDYKLIPRKTVAENVGFVLKAVGGTDEEIEESVPRALEIVGLEGKGERFPRELSSGEKQRVAIARALIHKPKVILADEPTGNLDPANTREVVELLRKINEFGTTVIIATHARDIIRRLRTRTLLLRKGRLAKDAYSGKILI